MWRPETRGPFPHGGFLTLLEDYDTEDPTMEEISRSVWADLALLPSERRH